MARVIRHRGPNFTWDGVDIHPYKEEGGTHFKSITRQTLFKGGDDLDVEFRYFEIQAEGHSTLERHEHSHLVMIIRGSGTVLVGDVLTPLEVHDLVRVPPLTWHQFRANRGQELGFLCVVSTERDRPQRPSAEDLEVFSQSPDVQVFIRV